MLISQKWQVHFCEGSPSACAFGAASGGRRERKPKVFIRSDALVVRAGINIRGRAPLSTPVGGQEVFFDKLRQLRYNIFKYNTQGKRRSAHHPKGGVAYDEIIGFHYCLVKRYKVGDNHHSQKITALLTPER